MPRFNYFQNSFQYGELSPRFLARTDTEQYQKGASTIENMIVIPSGGVTRRPGTVFVDKFLTTATDAINGFSGMRVIEFTYSKTESYCMVLLVNASGDLIIKAYEPAGVRGGKPSTIPVATLVSDGTAWNQTQLDEIHFVQSADILFLTQKDHPPIVVVRTSLGIFTPQYYNNFTPNFVFLTGLEVLNRPYRPTNTTATTLTPAATTGTNITLTASTAIFNAGMAPMGIVTETATYFKITHAGVTGVCKVRSFTSTTSVQVDIVKDFGATTASDNWQESSWSHYRGWPSAVGIFESRLFMGGNDAQPDTFWASRIENFFQFMQNRLADDSATDVSGYHFFGAVAATDPFDITPSAKEINRISWIQSGRTLAIGTLGSEFVALGSEAQAISALSIQLRDQTTIGSSDVQAIRINKSTLFCSRDGKNIYHYAFDNLSDSYLAESLTDLADHIPSKTVFDERIQTDESVTEVGIPNNSNFIFKSIKWQPSRKVLWVLSSNRLSGLTWNPSVKCLGWHRHILGKTAFDNADTNKESPDVISMAVVPTSDGKLDNLWLGTLRTINEDFDWYLEIMGPDYDEPFLYASGLKTTGNAMHSSDEICVYADLAGGSYNSLGSTTHTFAHLKGETLDVIADGFYHPQVTADATTGVITLNRSAKNVIAGLKYTPKLKIPPIEAGSQIGSAQGMTLRADRATIRFYNTLNAQIEGPEETETIEMRPGNLGMNDTLPMFTGDKKVNVPVGPEARQEIVITQNRPFPMTVLGVVLRGQTNE